jgi:hypothetical protein
MRGTVLSTGEPSLSIPPFSDAELTAIRQVWQTVAEDFAPFNINVTTAVPSFMRTGSYLNARFRELSFEEMKDTEAIVEGIFHRNGTFEAETLLTKCPSRFDAGDDEYYDHESGEYKTVDDD